MSEDQLGRNMMSNPSGFEPTTVKRLPHHVSDEDRYLKPEPKAGENIPSWYLDFDPGNDDCKECGACCSLVGGQVPGDLGYVEMLESDFIRMGITPTSHGHLLTKKRGTSPGTSGYYLKVLPEDSKQGACCPFMQGFVHDPSYAGGSCGIYEQRPMACRVFPKGSSACKTHRSTHYYKGNTRIKPRYVGPPELVDRGSWTHKSDEEAFMERAERDFPEKVPAGFVHVVGEPEFIGKFPLRRAPVLYPDRDALSPPEHEITLLEPTKESKESFDAYAKVMDDAHRQLSIPREYLFPDVKPEQGEEYVRLLQVGRDEEGTTFIDPDKLPNPSAATVEEIVSATYTVTLDGKCEHVTLGPVSSRDSDKPAHISMSVKDRKVIGVQAHELVPPERTQPEELYILPGDFSKANRLLVPQRIPACDEEGPRDED